MNIRGAPGLLPDSPALARAAPTFSPGLRELGVQGSWLVRGYSGSGLHRPVGICVEAEVCRLENKV